jgi:hypothetical protein
MFRTDEPLVVDVEHLAKLVRIKRAVLGTAGKSKVVADSAADNIQVRIWACSV